jgi:hypothetical protein
MATTISRASLTDGVSVWNAALVGSAIYDKIDALLAGAVTIGGLVNSTGLGIHTFSTGGTGGNVIAVQNTTAGTTNYSETRIGNDTDTGTTRLMALSTTYTTYGYLVQGGSALLGQGVGGLSLAALHALGEVRVYVGGATTLTTKWSSAGILSHTSGVEFTGAHDYSLTGSSAISPSGTQFCLRITSATSTPKLSAIAYPVAGATFLVVNASGAAFDIEHEWTVVSASYRIVCPADTNVVMAANDSALFWYDTTSSRWRFVARGSA